MESTCCHLQVGKEVPDFTVDTYEPSRGDFSSFNLKEQIKKKRWSIVIFYPADFTFV